MTTTTTTTTTRGYYTDEIKTAYQTVRDALPAVAVDDMVISFVHRCIAQLMLGDMDVALFELDQAVFRDEALGMCRPLSAWEPFYAAVYAAGEEQARRDFMAGTPVAVA